MTTRARDFLAIAFIGNGSSFARGPDLDECLDRLGRKVVADWATCRDLAGRRCAVEVFEVPPGVVRLWWNRRGIFAEDGERQRVTIARVERRSITLPAS